MALAAILPVERTSLFRNDELEMPFSNTHDTTHAATLAERWKARYRGATQPPTANWNETIDSMLSHRSVRSYLPDRLPEGALEVALAAAQSAPSSSNLQVWDVVVVQDPARKSRLNALADNQRQIEQAPVLLVWLADLARLRRLAQLGDIPTEGLSYFECFVLGIVDAALAAQNALVAFESLGLGTCYVGALRNHPKEVAAELGLPAEVVAVFGMTVGVPDPEFPASVKPRLPQRVVRHDEVYTGFAERDIAAYNGSLREFQAEQAMPAIDWAKQAARRVSTAEALHHRDKLKDHLLSLGFGLR